MRIIKDFSLKAASENLQKCGAIASAERVGNGRKAPAIEQEAVMLDLPE